MVGIELGCEAPGKAPDMTRTPKSRPKNSRAAHPIKARASRPKISRAHFDRVAKTLRTQLLGLQDQLKSEDFPVLLLFAGSEIAGKSESLNLITEWLDPRWIITRAYGPPTDEESQRPDYWRYWRDLPPNGQIGLFVGSWYHHPVHALAGGDIGRRKFHAELDEVRAFEQTLADSGALLLKFWLHLDKKALKKRMTELENDEATAWRISKTDWKHLKQHGKLHKAHVRAVAYTQAEDRAWISIDAADPRARALTILTTLRDSLARHIKQRRARRAKLETLKAAKDAARREQLSRIAASLKTLEKSSDAPAPPRAAAKSRRGAALARLDLSKRLGDDDYEDRLQQGRADLGRLFRRLHFEGKSAVILFEGPDAAGKGGAIRRLTGAMDARDFRVIQIAAPSEEERAHHYLWRFWKHVPKAGRITLFDRSWYGRVLVERVEGFAQPEEWMRAYDEINDFERQLTAQNRILVKFWIHISKDEQYRRFKERETISYKKWKLTAEDWRNREKWDDYTAAVDDMVKRTSTKHAPWTLVEGNDKQFARIKVMDTVCRALRRSLKNGA